MLVLISSVTFSFLANEYKKGDLGMHSSMLLLADIAEEEIEVTVGNLKELVQQAEFEKGSSKEIMVKVAKYARDGLSVLFSFLGFFAAPFPLI